MYVCIYVYTFVIIYIYMFIILYTVFVYICIYSDNVFVSPDFDWSRIVVAMGS